MATGVMVATDRRTSGTVVEDNAISLKASSRISDNLGDRVHINVTSYNRQVLLTGEVPNAQDKQLAEKIVSNVENVSGVVNELAISGLSTLSQRSTDSLVTSRVKGSLVDAKDLSANAFKITTERGTVYLMGRVTQREANRATEVITATSGVQKLVRILEIISEDELARMTQ
jgi:osmotically-inducible protein OsmY